MEKHLVEDYCSFELSKLLKEKGFKDSCLPSFTSLIRQEGDEFQCCPTHALAMKWLREVHNLHIAVNRGYEQYYVVITKIKPYQDLTMKEDAFDIYEEAVEAAIKYSLENLI